VVTPDAAGYGRLVLMWGAMSAAMMLPTMLPALATYDELPTTDARGAGGLIGGYMAVWLGFSVLAAAAQLGLWQAGLLDALGVSTERWLTALLLAGAGAYQFTAFKAACLSRCRQPLTFFMQHWAPGTRNAAAMGLRLGALCLGCCWALMALGFVGGTLNLVWMGVATVLMVIEKLPLTGRYLTAPLGVALLAAAPFAAAGLL
jgi:predicted metal-binding membrane protein